MATRAFAFLFLFFSSFLSVFSLYEDQVGLVDWHQQYIGKVKHAVFQTQKAGRKRVVVSTEENVIACLDLRRGEIFWRHLLGDKDSVDQIDIALSKYVITLSSEGTVLRAWNLPDGQMVWETFLAGKAPSSSLLLIATDPKIGRGNVIFVYSNGCIHAVSSLDGTIIWNLELADQSSKVQQLVQPIGSDVVYAVSGSSHLHVHEVCVKTGALLKHEVAEFSGGFSGEISVVSGDTLVALDDATTSLVAVHLKNGNIRFQKKSIPDIVPGFSGVAVMLPTKLGGMFAVKVNSSVAFIRVNGDGLMEVVDKIEHPVAISDALSLTDEEQAFGLVQHKGEKIHMFVKLGQDWSGDLLKESIEMDQHRGFVERVFVNNYIKTDRSYGFRALVVMEDHSLLLLQQGNIVWSREDGLASVIDITTSELPVERKGVSVAKVEHSLLDWLKGHLLKIKGSLMLASQEDVAAIQTLRLKSSGKSKMNRDHNGFRKLLIVLTKGRKLFALHTGDGRVVWSLLLPSLRESEVCRSPSALNVYQWQVPHHHALDENPSVLVVGKCGSSDATTGVLSFVDTYTGMELESSRLSHSVAQVIPLQHMDSTERRLHLIIDANGLSHLYPRTTEAAAIFQRVLPNISWYSVDADNSIVKGYALKSNCISEQDDQFCFDSNDLWSIVFPSDSEKIVATTTRKASEVVHTQGKLMPDRDVLYKYISKNILFVATVAPKGAGDIGAATPEESWLVVYLIDTITGRLLHRMTHHGSQGPVNAVFSENWVVYHYFNLRAHRYEVSIIEIYDESRANNKDVLKLIVGKHNLTSPISSYSRPEVTAKSQSYFFTHSVKEMAVTLTQKGITSKQILIGTVGDQILAIDKRYLDPRRSINPTQAEKEEGIIPLTDSLPIIPQSYVSHALKVEGLRGIMTIPSKLESTTLMFAHGVDLFFTHLAPSRTYDSLTEDFSYALLLLTIVALVVAIFVTWILSQRKELRDKWR